MNARPERGEATIRIRGVVEPIRILRIGMKGEDVLDLQVLLGVKADGHFGPKTLAAVILFQTKNGIEADGIVGPITRLMLGRPPGPAPAPGSPYRTLAEIVANLEEGTAAFAEACWKILTYDPGTEASIQSAAKRVLKYKGTLYAPFEAMTGIPWAMTAVIHSMECGNDPLGCLHNGQRIIGTTKKTTIVPKGRGPFNKFKTVEENWLDAAKDAIAIDTKWHVADWTIGTMLRQIERFNGTGYITGAGKSEISPYLYARTNINDGRGKYVSDGHFDPNADANAQVGAAAILKQLEVMGEFTPTYKF